MSSRLVLHTRVVTGSGGGPDKTILNSPRFLADDYPMVCAYLRDPSDRDFAELERRAERWRAPLVAIDDHGPFDLGLGRRLHALCAERRPAIWHAHDYKSNYYGLRMVRRHPMALVTTVHGWGVQGSWKTALYYRLDRRLIGRYDEVICVSEDIYEECRRFGVSEERCWLVPNAIDTDEFRRSRDPTAPGERGSVPAGRKVIGAVGRLSAEKCLDDLVRALARLVGEGHDLELWLIGDGPQRGSLEGFVSELGLSDRVRFLGYRDDTIDLYRGMDIYALSSRKEGLPNVLLEAMAMELPIVATRIAGIPQLIEDGSSGLLVEPEAPEELAAALRRLIAADGYADSLGRAARATIERRHSMRQRMEKMREIYDVALARAGGGR